MSKVTIELDLVETDLFEELLSVANEMLGDDGIPLNIRDKYRYRLENLNNLIE